MKDWQEGLRALLPNINISFGTQQTTAPDTRPNSSQHQQKSMYYLISDIFGNNFKICVVYAPEPVLCTLQELHWHEGSKVKVQMVFQCLFLH